MPPATWKGRRLPSLMSGSLESREGNPLGGWEALPEETEGWADSKRKPSPLGQWVACRQDAAPDKTTPPLLCLLRVSPWHSFQTFPCFQPTSGKVLPSCRRGALCKQACAWPQAHTLYLSPAFCVSHAGRARSTGALPALSATGLVPFL